MELGFPEHTARNIIKQSKAIAVAKFEETSNSTNKRKDSIESSPQTPPQYFVGVFCLIWI